MKKSRVCDLLDIEYPIIQAAMPWISNAALAAAVSNAGGLGVVTPTASLPSGGDLRENLRAQIRLAHSYTDRPIGVGFYLRFPDVQGLMDVAIGEGVHIAITYGGSPALHTGYLKDHEVKIIHSVASVRHARSAEGHGVDVVVAEGFEGGGLRGVEEIPTFVLLPQIVDAVEIPVIASGGIADARGFVAALALGAEGVQIGTRFIATHECAAHPRYKEAIVKAIDTGTVVIGRSHIPVRLLKTPGRARLQEGNASESSPREFAEEALPDLRQRALALEGNLEEGIAYCSAGAGLVNEILSAAEVVQSLVEGARKIARDLQ